MSTAIPPIIILFGKLVIEETDALAALDACAEFNAVIELIAAGTFLFDAGFADSTAASEFPDTCVRSTSDVGTAIVVRDTPLDIDVSALDT
jgi:hypothetical protein